MAEYTVIPILTAAERCGIKINTDTNKAEIAVRCIFCDDKRRHLHMNTIKNQFYCHRCGEYGNSISLYSKLAGCTNKQAYAELTCDGVSDIPAAPVQEREPSPLMQRHAVYAEFLQMLSLSSKHKEALLRRGLDSAAVVRNMYKSVPNRTGAARIAESLSQRHDLRGIPGFFRNSDGKWNVSAKAGFFVPARDSDRYIQGLMVRLDNTADHKYEWLSSRYKRDGTKARAWLHVAGSVNKLVHIVEGPLTADVSAHLRDDACFIALPGVHSQNGLIPLLQHMGVKAVTEAFDMDKISNANVASAVVELKRKLSAEQISCQSITWDAKFKGLDDYYQFCRYLDSDSAA